MCVGVYLSWNDGWCVDSTWKKISHVQVVVIKGSNETFRVEKVFNPCLVLSCDSVEESDQRVFLTTLFANAMALPVLTEARISDVFLSQDAPSVAGLPISMDVPGSKPLLAPHLSETFRTVDPTSVALIEGLRWATDVEDLTGQDASSVASLCIGMDVPGSKPLLVPHPPEAFQTVDPTSAVLIKELRQTIDVEDLTSQFDHIHCSQHVRGGYSDVYVTHWKHHTQPNLIPVCQCIGSYITPAH